jgi:hypothetical protein
LESTEGRTPERKKHLLDSRYWVNGAVTNAQIDENSVTLTGTTNGVDNNTDASYLTNGDVPLTPFAQGVFNS